MKKKKKKKTKTEIRFETPQSEYNISELGHKEALPETWSTFTIPKEDLENSERLRLFDLKELKDDLSSKSGENWLIELLSLSLVLDRPIFRCAVRAESLREEEQVAIRIRTSSTTEKNPMELIDG